MGARPSRAAENAEATSEQFRQGMREMKEKAKETYERGKEYAAEKYKKYQLQTKSPELTDSDYSFFTENTGKSREDIKQIFNKYNLNKEGAKLDRQGFINIYQELNPDLREQANENADQAFRVFDTDNSGYLSFNEFMVSYALLSRGEMRQKLDYAFDLYDTDRSGYLEKDEVKQVINALCDLLGAEKKNKNSQQVIDKTFRDIQFDEQGRVTKEQFINGLMKNEDIRELMEPYGKVSSTSTSTSSTSASTTSEPSLVTRH